MSEPCPATSPAGRACQGKRGHVRYHWCCYPGGTDRWHTDPSATHDAMLARIADLEAIVARLPHTADGVPVVPGMDVWYPKELWRSWTVDFADDIWMVHINPDHKGNVWYGVQVHKCYSNHAAAEKASKV